VLICIVDMACDSSNNYLTFNIIFLLLLFFYISYWGAQYLYWVRVRIGVKVFNAIFNNISVISWWSVSLVEETRVPGENHWPAAGHWQTISHNIVSRFELTTVVVIGSDCTGSCKSIHHTITTTTTHYLYWKTNFTLLVK
jgi:hypothetical protein